MRGLSEQLRADNEAGEAVLALVIGQHDPDCPLGCHDPRPVTDVDGIKTG